MKRVIIGLAAGIVLCLISVCPASAQGPGPAGPGHPGICGDIEHPLLPPELARLGIDKNRMDAIRQIELTVRKDSIRKEAELHIASIELGELLGKDTVDMAAVGAKLKQIAALRTDVEFSRIKAIEEVKAKLTSEERKRLRGLVESACMRPPMPPRFGSAGPLSSDEPPPPRDQKKAPGVKEKVR